MLLTHPERSFAILPGAEPLLEELWAVGKDLDFLPERFRPQGNPGNDALDLGRHWEPDYLLLAPDPREHFKLLCGCVCFPSGWDLREKMGRGIELIHEAVPTLNSQIGDQINSFLARMKPGVSWNRVNWGMSRSPELDQHPQRRLPRLDESVLSHEVFLRVEEQSLTPLPKTGGILFGIRILVFTLAELKTEKRAVNNLVNLLKSMPPEVARYKGLLQARARIIDLLEK